MKKIFFIIVLLLFCNTCFAKAPDWLLKKHKLDLYKQSSRFKLEIREARHQNRIYRIRSGGIRNRRRYIRGYSLNSYAVGLRANYSRCPYIY